MKRFLPLLLAGTILAAYASLLKSRRAMLHCAIAEALAAAGTVASAPTPTATAPVAAAASARGAVSIASPTCCPRTRSTSACSGRAAPSP